MRKASPVVVAIIGMGVAAGCRATSRVVEAPRIDLELEGGNRGYLVGTPPPSTRTQTTRQVVEAEVEVPGFFQAKPRFGSSKAKNLKQIAPPEMNFSEEIAAPASSAQAPNAGSYDAYVVKKRDTLWSIAADPQVYGDATRWREIFEANRDLLKSPDRLRAGMRLRIPRGQFGASQAASEPAVFSK